MVIASSSRGNGITDWITDGLGLSPHGSRTVSTLSSSHGQILSITAAFGLASVAAFGISLTGAIQAVYELIWRLHAGGWHQTWRQAAALGGATAYLVIAAWSDVPWRHTAAQPVLRILATLIGGLLLFWWLPHLLPGGRVPWRGLLPGTAFTTATLVGLRCFSRLVFAPLPGPLGNPAPSELPVSINWPSCPGAHKPHPGGHPRTKARRREAAMWASANCAGYGR
ncbi:hypothetical protein ACIRYZ_42745 [Kitasatospora sp. NPDC101155]|uniref:hypothetical protein n=1 Tax=Kitasatospora sp. NPDC101155 TaxID=3364097 RepID=UPI0038223068